MYYGLIATILIVSIYYILGQEAMIKVTLLASPLLIIVGNYIGVKFEKWIKKQFGW